MYSKKTVDQKRGSFFKSVAVTVGCALLALVLLPRLASAQTPQVEPQPAQAARAINTFSMELFKKLSKKDKNLIVSPYSVSSALAMCYLGAEGTTAKEMEQALHFNTSIHASFAALQKRMNDVSTDTAVVQVANALWPSVKMKMKDEFVQRVKEYYRAPIQQLDFSNNPKASADTINAWTKEKTRGRITNIVSERDFRQSKSSTSLVLTNAVYFRSQWAKEFSPKLTKRAPFFMENGATRNVDLMSQRGSFAYYDTGKAQLLRLPYKNDAFEMIVMLPKKDISIAQQVETLSTSDLERWLGLSQNKDVLVFLPKFRLEQTFELVDPLKEMGMKEAFSETKADFRRIGTLNNVSPYIGKVRHKTFIEVGERETEAAAVTAVITVGATSFGGKRPEPILFRADRPFIYLIRDRATGVILFVGRYADPVEIAK